MKFPAIIILLLVLCSAAVIAAGSPCANGVKDGSETGVDCGGSCGATCANGVACGTSADCLSSYCNAGVCASIGGSCSDGVKNGQETDIDCGGFTCSPCTTGQTCMLSSDCVSSVCNGGVCYAPAPSCSDGIENGAEDGVDCGGSCPNACASLDITLGSNTPGNHEWTSGNAADNIMFQLRAQVHGVKVITLKQLHVAYAGSGNTPNGVDAVKVVLDENENGAYEPAIDTSLGQRAWPAGESNMYLSLQPAVEFDYQVDAIKYLLIIYHMRSPVTGTYVLNVDRFLADVENDDGLTQTLSFSVTKTVTSAYVSPSCNNNGVRDADESGVDCGGAYCPQCSTGSCSDNVRNGDESGVDCGGRCPTCPYPAVHCPNGVQDGDETGVDCGGLYCPACNACPSITTGCDPNSPPVCDDVTRTASICLSGIYTPVPGMYENQCQHEPEPTCTPGTTVCFEGAVSFCAPSGFWGPADTNPTLWSQYCENDGCDSAEIFCDPTGMAYACSNGRYVYQGPCAPETECNPGEISCDYANYRYDVCGEDGQWPAPDNDGDGMPNFLIVAPQEGFFDVCPVNRDLLGCEDGSVQCNPAFDRQEKCVDGAWLPIEQSAAQYTAACGSVACNPGWFACNPAAERIQYCVNGQWGTETTQGYADFCEPEGATLGGNADGGGAFSRGEDRVLVGSVVNNTVVVIRSIPGFPVTPPPALEKTVVQTLQSIPWWLLALLVLLLCSTLFTIAKYHNHLVADKKGKR